MLALPKHIEDICGKLEKNGFAAYAVGGCVRDLLMGRVPGDYDVTTAALPDDMKKIFPHTVDTGIAHGTVTVVLPEGNVEVTTFRKDGDYADSRHPESVTFVSEIDADLGRRDFTVNAMAYSPQRGLCDPYGGRGDLKRKILRTVGEPRRRFSEDALRILRLFRFAAQLSFDIEEETEKVAKEMAKSLSRISRERIYAELSKMLSASSAEDLKRAEEIFKVVMPFQALPQVDYEKIEKCKSISGKWALLLGENSAEILRSLHAPRRLILSAGELSAYTKGAHIVLDVMKLRHTSAEEFFAFLNDKNAEETYFSAQKSGVPTTYGDLAVAGEELAKIGFKGREIGETLDMLFMYVLEKPANNIKEKLMEVAEWIYKQKH